MPRRSASHGAQRAGRRLALEAVFEAEFGQRTARTILERVTVDQAPDPAAAELARAIVEGAILDRQGIDDRIAQAAPAYPVSALARIDRALLRCALSEVLHCPATPQRVAIAEWVELARRYSGEPARRLVNGVLGRVTGAVSPGPVAADSTREGRAARPPGGST